MLGAACYGTGPRAAKSYPPMGLLVAEALRAVAKTGSEPGFGQRRPRADVVANMPRQSRLVLPQVATHIVQRGNNKDVTFLVESDYLVYMHHLRDLAGKLECAVHAYCLMTNHVHLLVTPTSREACISLMRNLGQRYVQYFNRCHYRTGTLWEGRFRSCVAESSRYVLACYRYIEMNPVRAGMVAAPQDYRWSSHSGNIGVREDPLLSPHPEFSALAADRGARWTAYRDLFVGQLDPLLLEEIRNSTNAGYPLAGESFKVTIAEMTKRRLAPGKSGRPPKKGEDGTDLLQGDLLPETGL